MIDEVLKRLIEFLQGASPLVWSALIKQVYIEALARLAWAVGLLVITFLLVKLVNFQKKAYEEKYNDGRFFSDSEWAWLWAGVAATGIASFALIVSALMWFANPEFYAIRYVIEKIGGG